MTLAKYFVDVAVPALAPVKVSVIAVPAAYVPLITKVVPESSPAEVIVTCRPAPLSKLAAPDVKTKLASPVTVALFEIAVVFAVSVEAVKVAVKVLLSLVLTLLKVPFVSAMSAFVNEPAANASPNTIVTVDASPLFKDAVPIVIVASEASTTFTSSLALFKP